MRGPSRANVLQHIQDDIDKLIDGQDFKPDSASIAFDVAAFSWCDSLTLKPTSLDRSCTSVAIDQL